MMEIVQSSHVTTPVRGVVGSSHAYRRGERGIRKLKTL
jgi:hypothetical protein